MTKRFFLKFKNENKGFAMIFAIIVSLVVIAFCLSLLLVSYNLYASTQNKIMDLQCQEIAKSMSKQIEEEITTNFGSYAEQDAAKANDDYDLWFYLRYNLLQTTVKYPTITNPNGSLGSPYFWPYVSGSTNKSDAIREFDVNLREADAYSVIYDSLKVRITWEPDEEKGNWEKYNNSKWVIPSDKIMAADGTELKVEVTCERGNSVATVTTIYNLNVTEYTDEAFDSDGEIPEKDNSSISSNPCGFSINTKERWNFVKDVQY